MRFLLQAVNGVGLVGVDNNLGLYYAPAPVTTIGTPAATATGLTLTGVPGSIGYGATLSLAATLTAAPAGSVVTFDISGQGPVSAITDASGKATASIPVNSTPGTYQVTASYAGTASFLPSSAVSSSFTVTKAGTTLTLSSTKKVFAIGGAPKLPALRLASNGAVAPAQSTALIPVFNIDSGLVATLKTAAGQPLSQRSVLFTLKGTLFRQTVTAARTTDLNGNAVLGVLALVPDVYTITAVFGLAATGTSVDPVYASSAITPASVLFGPNLPITIVLPVKTK